MSLVVNPYSYFTDTNGNALNGYLYVGEVGKNAENYPIAIFYDNLFTTPAPNPLTISAGYIYNGGTIAQIYASVDYSIIVKKTDGSLVYSGLNETGMTNGAIANIDEMKSFVAPYDNYALIVLGYSEAGDGGGGVFYYDANSTEDDNGGTIIEPTSGSGRWVRQYSGAVNVKWFGAKGDGVTDDTASVSSLLSAITANTTVVFNVDKIKLSPGVLSLTDVNNLTLDFTGTEILIDEHLSTTAILTLTSCENITLVGGIVDFQDKFTFRFLYASSCIGITITDMTFRNARYPNPEYVVSNLSSALTFATCTNIRVFNNTFFNWFRTNYDNSLVDTAGTGGEHLGRCIDFHSVGENNCTDVYVDSNRFRQVRLANVGVLGVAKFIGNTFDTLSDNAIYCSGDLLTIANNTFNGGEESIVPGVSGTINIVGNVFQNVVNKCISTTNNIDSINIIGNTFESTGDLNAIKTRTEYTGTSGTIKIQNNIFKGDIDYAMIYLGTWDTVTISDNSFIIYDTTTSGYIYNSHSAASNLVVVTNNTIEKSNVWYNTFTINATHVVFENNTGLSVASDTNITNHTYQEIMFKNKYPLLGANSYDLTNTGALHLNSLGGISSKGAGYGVYITAESDCNIYSGMQRAILGAAGWSHENGDTADNATIYDVMVVENAGDTFVKSAFFHRNGIYPGVDNARNLGSLSYRWDNVYATNGTIQTSDEREKQQITDLSEVERQTAIQLKGMIKKFKWNSSVNDKGDKARWHFGAIAQEVKQVFEDNGLNPDEYGIFIYSSWENQYTTNVITPAEIAEDGTIIKEAITEQKLVTPAGDRYGIRYTELAMFILGAL